MAEDEYKFNMSMESLMRLNKQLYAIWESKRLRNPMNLHRDLIILEEELYPFLLKLKNYEDDMKRLRDVKGKVGKAAQMYFNAKSYGEGSAHLEPKLYAALSEYDGLLRRFMQELKLLMSEGYDPKSALEEGK